MTTNDPLCRDCSIDQNDSRDVLAFLVLLRRRAPPSRHQGVHLAVDAPRRRLRGVLPPQGLHQGGVPEPGGTLQQDQGSQHLERLCG